jgi:hypothetical protein
MDLTSEFHETAGSRGLPHGPGTPETRPRRMPCSAYEPVPWRVNASDWVCPGGGLHPARTGYDLADPSPFSQGPGRYQEDLCTSPE